LTIKNYLKVFLRAFHLTLIRKKSDWRRAIKMCGYHNPQ